MNRDPPASGKRDGPSKDIDPGDSHSGEGLASVRPRLARTLQQSEILNAERSKDVMSDGIPPEPAPEPEEVQTRPSP
jgi:hypothetical protein